MVNVSNDSKESIKLDKNELIEIIKNSINAVKKFQIQNEYHKVALETLDYIYNMINSIIEENPSDLWGHLFYRISISVKKIEKAFTYAATNVNEFNDGINGIFSNASNLQNHKYYSLLKEITDCSNDSKKEYNNICEYVKKTKDLGELLTKKLEIGDFEKRANSHKSVASWFRAFSIIVFIIAVFPSVLLILEQMNLITIVGNIAIAISSKITLTALLISLSIYLGKIADFHRRAEGMNRKTALDIATIDLFVANMNPEQKADIKKNVALKIFGVDKIFEGEDKGNKSTNCNITLNLDPQKILDSKN